jgi:glycerol-3-phosphate acyltransferase PlsY
MSDSYLKDRARLHVVHRWAWLTLALAVAGAAGLSFAWGDGHLGNVLGLWWAIFVDWVGAPGINTKIGEMVAPARLILASLATDSNHPFWITVVSHSRELAAALVASPMLSAAILAAFKIWKTQHADDDIKIKRGAEILDAKSLTKKILQEDD